MFKTLHHIAIAVKNINDTLKVFTEVLGLRLVSIEEVGSEGVKVATLKLPHVDKPLIELLEPLNENSVVARFLERRGEGIHHIAFEVDNIHIAIQMLKDKLKLLSTQPRVGAGGRRIIFIHPRSVAGVLLELVEEG